MDLAYDERRGHISDLNPHLLCSLCSGYMIDASTIVECLHSFCKSCIYKYLESSKYCPICDVQIHKTKPHLNIKSDKTLQTLIYKLVPDLLKSELQRRQQFFDENPDTDVSSLSIILPTEHHHIVDRYKFLRSFRDRSDWISICLSLKKVSTEESLESCFKEVSMTRYLFCPPDVKVVHIKKLLREKFELNESTQVEMFHNETPLHDFNSLSVVTETNGWDKVNPFQLEYCIKIAKVFPEKENKNFFKFQTSQAFKAKFQSRLREMQLRGRHFNKRKLKKMEVRVDDKKKKISFCNRQQIISNRGSTNSTTIPVNSQIPNVIAVPTLSKLASSSLPVPPPIIGEEILKHPPVLIETNIPSHLKSNTCSSPRSSQLSSRLIQSSSSLKSNNKSDCVITDVQLRKLQNDSKKNRNIFDLVRPMLKSSIFNKSYQNTSNSGEIRRDLSTSIDPSLHRTSISLMTNTSTCPIIVPSGSSSEASLARHERDFPTTVDVSLEGISSASISSSKENHKIPEIVEEKGSEASHDFLDEINFEKQNMDRLKETEVDQTRATSSDLLRCFDDSPIVRRMDSSTSLAAVTMETENKIRARKSNSTSHIDLERSTFFEKFSKDLEIIGTPKQSSTEPGNHVVRSNGNSASPLDVNFENSKKKTLNSEALKRFCPSSETQKLMKRVKIQERKFGFEASCKSSEGIATPTDEDTKLNDRGLDASTRSYKISKREMCGLFMDMSKKYLEEFPANGFALDSVTSEDDRPQVPGHQRRSKQKL